MQTSLTTKIPKVGIMIMTTCEVLKIENIKNLIIDIILRYIKYAIKLKYHNLKNKLRFYKTKQRFKTTLKAGKQLSKQTT